MIKVPGCNVCIHRGSEGGTGERSCTYAYWHSSKEEVGKIKGVASWGMSRISELRLAHVGDSATNGKNVFRDSQWQNICRRWIFVRGALIKLTAEYDFLQLECLV